MEAEDEHVRGDRPQRRETLLSLGGTGRAGEAADHVLPAHRAVGGGRDERKHDQDHAARDERARIDVRAVPVGGWLRGVGQDRDGGNHEGERRRGPEPEEPGALLLDLARRRPEEDRRSQGRERELEEDSWHVRAADLHEEVHALVAGVREEASPGAEAAQDLEEGRGPEAPRGDEEDHDHEGRARRLVPLLGQESDEAPDRGREERGSAERGVGLEDPGEVARILGEAAEEDLRNRGQGEDDREEVRGDEGAHADAAAREPGEAQEVEGLLLALGADQLGVARRDDEQEEEGVRAPRHEVRERGELAEPDPARDRGEGETDQGHAVNDEEVDDGDRETPLVPARAEHGPGDDRVVPRVEERAHVVFSVPSEAMSSRRALAPVA